MFSRERLIILDADGTIIDAFGAIEKTFGVNGMDIGDLDRFRKRHHMFKYLGGIKEFPKNLRKQVTKEKRKKLLRTLTEVYREEASMYGGMVEMIHCLQERSDVRLGVITRNITVKPLKTLRLLFRRHDIDPEQFDFLVHLPLKEDKVDRFRKIRARFNINPMLSYACGDEIKDYRAAIRSGMHPLMVSYGFDDYLRLYKKYDVPKEIISHSPAELSERLLHALGVL